MQLRVSWNSVGSRLPLPGGEHVCKCFVCDGWGLGECKCGLLRCGSSGRDRLCGVGTLLVRNRDEELSDVFRYVCGIYRREFAQRSHGLSTARPRVYAHACAHENTPKHSRALVVCGGSITTSPWHILWETCVSVHHWCARVFAHMCVGVCSIAPVSQQALACCYSGAHARGLQPFPAALHPSMRIRYTTRPNLDMHLTRHGTVLHHTTRGTTPHHTNACGCMCKTATSSTR